VDNKLSKACSRCLEVKPMDKFHFHDGAKDGRHSYCKACLTAYNRERYVAKAKARMLGA